MSIPKSHLGFKGDECQCGRRATLRHCTSCGSSRTYARHNRLHTLASGEEKFVKIQFCCQACGHEFIEEEREFCDAPPVSSALARQKVQAIAQAKEQGEYLRPADAKLAEAIQKLGGLPSINVKTETRLKNAWFELRRVYIDADEATKSKPLIEFLELSLRGFWPDNEVDQILAWQREENQRAS